MALVEYSKVSDLVENQSLFNLMIYLGDKREFKPLKKRLTIPVIYNSYSYVDVYVESKEFKDLLLAIDKFGSENDIWINYFDNTSFEETLKFINKYEVSDCFVLLSKNTDTIYKFMSAVKVNKFYINKNPFEDYRLDLDERDLVYKKRIFLKKM